MKAILAIAIAALVMVPVWAENSDLLNKAAVKALESAKDSLAQATKAQNIKRIGVANLEGDTAHLSALLKSVMTKTDFDIVLTSDADWGPLLDEFYRQTIREKLVVPETAHQLRVQGVDAVMYGTVEKAAVENLNENGMTGPRATVRMILNLASLSESNPGSMVWSEQVTGTEEQLQFDWGAWLTGLVLQYRYFLYAFGVLFILFIVWLGYRRAITPR